MERVPPCKSRRGRGRKRILTDCQVWAMRVKYNETSKSIKEIGDEFDVGETTAVIAIFGRGAYKNV